MLQTFTALPPLTFKCRHALGLSLTVVCQHVRMCLSVGLSETATTTNKVTWLLRYCFQCPEVSRRALLNTFLCMPHTFFTATVYCFLKQGHICECLIAKLLPKRLKILQIRPFFLLYSLLDCFQPSHSSMLFPEGYIQHIYSFSCISFFS